MQHAVRCGATAFVQQITGTGSAAAEDGVRMPQASLIAWIITAGAGLYLLTIWLIEYDREFQASAATRLPVPVISAHALLAITGLVVWGIYLLTDTDRLAWVATFILAPVALFGLIMGARWITVYRTHAAPSAVAAGAGAGSARNWTAVPPERHFPLSVVIGHGVFAVVTVVLVVLTTLGVGGS
jgi:hypothetical protein